jgi:hypothetical protein
MQYLFYKYATIMENQQITIAQTTMHKHSNEFWEVCYQPTEPWYHVNDVIYNHNARILIATNKKFIYPVYTTGHPSNWLVSRNGLIHLLDKDILQYAAKGNVLIYINQICEGFSLISKNDDYWPQFDFNYYEELHNWLYKNSIPFKNLIYHTSNLLEEENYNRYCSENNIQEKIKIISQTGFAEIIKINNYFSNELEDIKLSFEEQYRFKVKNNIKLFSCLNRRDRPHRGALLLLLNYYNLVEGNHVSFPPFTLIENENNLIVNCWKDLHLAFEDQKVHELSKKLPLILDSAEFEINWAGNFLKETYLSTWISVITETLFQDQLTSVFVSEKVFKPMLALHPFLIVGQPNTIKELKKMGFKTFDKWWDESYDTEIHPIKRMEKICNILLDLKKLSKKQFLEMYKDMYNVLLHNQKHLLTTNFTRSESNEQYIKEFFKCI